MKAGWKHIERIIAVPLAAFAVFPIVFINQMLTSAILAFFHLGRWPYYNNPDPCTLPKSFHRISNAVEMGVFFLSLILGAGVLWLITGRLKSPRARAIAIAAAILAGWVFAFLYAWVDPWGVFEWYVD